MSDILEEAKIDHNEERKLNYFKRALPWVIGLTALVIIAMVWNDYRVSRQVAHNRAMGDMLIKAMQADEKDRKATTEAFEYLRATSGNGIGDVAALEGIHNLIQSGDAQGALDGLESLAKTAHLKFTQSYAKVEWMSIIVDKPKLSDHEREVLDIYLKDFTSDDTEFFGTANVLGAMLNAKNGELDLAKDALQKVIASDKVPPLVKDQAMAVLANLNI
jgi:hypothetical protein